jgi:hypothetical protein
MRNVFHSLSFADHGVMPAGVIDNLWILLPDMDAGDDATSDPKLLKRKKMTTVGTGACAWSSA